MDGLTGRRALVTGGLAGIGGAVAERLAGLGASVLVADREGGDLVADLSTLDGAAAMMAAAGPVDILVNNAGGVFRPRYPDSPPADWLPMLDLNLRSVLLTTQLAAESMRDRGGGSVVNIASSAGLGFGAHPVPEYAVAKAGVMRLTACLAPLAAGGVRVNCVCPDLVDTPTSRRGRAGLSAAELAAGPAPIPASEIAAAVTDLVLDGSLSGRVVVCQDAEPRRVLLPADDWSTYVARLGGTPW